MGYILYPIADLLEASFTIIPSIAESVNLLLMVVGSIATIGWIGLMMKYEKTEVPNR
jgi:hypothetical protein